MIDLTAASAAAGRSAPKTFHQANSSRTKASSQEAGAEASEMSALATRERHFDFMLEERAEDQRESESLDTLFLAQLKHQDEILKAWLRMA